MTAPARPAVSIDVLVLQTLALLVRGRELIEHRSHWTRGQYARDLRSRPVAPLSPDAIRLCAAGSLMRAEGELSGLEVPQLDRGDRYIGPKRFTWALELVGNELYRRYSQKADPAELDPKLAPLTGPQPTTRPAARARREALLNAVDPLNDAKPIRHADVLAAYDFAITFCDNLHARWFRAKR